MIHNAARIELWWLPLGAGGWFVRANGRLYEARPGNPGGGGRSTSTTRRWWCGFPEGRFVVENCWPIPDSDGARDRGVAVEGPVGSELIARFRVFRNEVRRWDGTIADAGTAVASPPGPEPGPGQGRRLLELVGELPRPV